VLPEIEKFLESPAEKRLRRIRVGTVLSAIGIGVAIALSLLAVISRKEDYLFLAALGGVTFFIGIAFVINGYLLTVAKGARMRSRPTWAYFRVEDTGFASRGRSGETLLRLPKARRRISPKNSLSRAADSTRGSRRSFLLPRPRQDAAVHFVFLSDQVGCERSEVRSRRRQGLAGDGRLSEQSHRRNGSLTPAAVFWRGLKRFAARDGIDSDHDISNPYLERP